MLKSKNSFSKKCCKRFDYQKTTDHLNPKLKKVYLAKYSDEFNKNPTNHLSTASTLNSGTYLSR